MWHLHVASVIDSVLNFYIYVICSVVCVESKGGELCLQLDNKNSVF